MKIAIITTVNHNVGDDFVREGIKYLLREHFKGEELEFMNIHKHSPITSRIGYESFRFNRGRVMNIVDSFVPKFFSKDRILEADVVIQSGAPVYWCHNNSHCYNNEWYKPLIKDRFLKNRNANLLNLAAGTCQKYHSDGSEFCDKCNKYIKEFYNLSTITTVRDTLAQTVLNNIGINVPIVPCSSIFAIDEHGLKNEGEEYVVMNYMKGGAHYTFGQKIDFDKWETTFKEFYYDVKSKERVIISCHNQKEVDEVLELDPKAEIFYAEDDYVEYMKFYSKAKFGIMNRVHGAFLMASYGKPSIVIGNDSRARMASEIGIEHYFVNDIDIHILNEQYEFLKSGANNFSNKFGDIKKRAFDLYNKEFKKLLNT